MHHLRRYWLANVTQVHLAGGFAVLALAYTSGQLGGWAVQTLHLPVERARALSTSVSRSTYRISPVWSPKATVVDQAGTRGGRSEIRRLRAGTMLQNQAFPVAYAQWDDP